MCECMSFIRGFWRGVFCYLCGLQRSAVLPVRVLREGTDWKHRSTAFKHFKMNYKNYKAYDNDDFFEQYTAKRNRPNAPNNILEKPIIDQLIQDVEGKDILDLGCGDGKFGLELLSRKSRSYHGIEGSENMFGLAVDNLKDTDARLECFDIEGYDYPKEKYDLIVSRLVLHYVENLEELFVKLHHCLREKGEFVFSIEHPIITSCYEAYHGKGRRENWIVDNYFESGERINHWIGKNVVKYHRTIEEYFQIIQNAEFEVLILRESKPNMKYFETQEEFERRMKIPLFMLFKLKKK